MKRGIALLLTMCMVLVMIPSVLAAEPTFTINGVTVSASSGSAVWNCSDYAGQILKKVWKGYNGKSVVTTTFNSPYNMLKGKSAEERKITEAHTKAYIQAAPLGSRIRISHYSSNTRDNYDNNQFGHTLVLVAKNDAVGTFTTLEAGGGKGETNTYTYESFGRRWGNFRVGYTYFFYVADLSCFGSEEGSPCTTHTRGEYRTFEAAHPHHTIYKCAVCGKDYADKNTSQYYEKCELCNPPQEVSATCTVTFDPNGGSVSQTSKQVTQGDLIGAVPTAVREGYTFAGWGFSRDFPELLIVGSNTGVYIDEDTTLYAQWRKDPEPEPEPEPAPEPAPDPEPYWERWSDWQDAEVSASGTRQVETREVEVAPARTEYRYGRWVNSEPFDHFCPTAAVNSGHRNDFRLDYTAWSETRLIKYNLKWFCTDRSHNHQHCAARNQTYNGKTGDVWHGYKTSANATADYYWEETRTVPATYKTQYRYRDLHYGS